MSENCELSKCQILQGLNVTVMVTCGDELATILNEKKSHSDYSNKAIFYK